MKTLLKILLTAALLLAQGGDIIPPYAGDPGTGRYKGMPQWCQARDENGYKKNCGICDSWCADGQESLRCKLYCRSKGNCRCHKECTLSGHNHSSPPVDRAR